MHTRAPDHPRGGRAARRTRAAVVLGIVVLVTTAILLFNLVVDLVYPLLDPRVDLRGATRRVRPVSESDTRLDKEGAAA